MQAKCLISTGVRLIVSASQRHTEFELRGAPAAARRTRGHEGV